MAKFDETPIVKDPAKEGVVTPPLIREHASEDVQCWPCKPKDNVVINLPSERVPDWQGLPPLRKKQLVKNLLRQSRVMIIQARKAGDQFHMEVRLVIPDSWSP